MKHSKIWAAVICLSLATIPAFAGGLKIDDVHFRGDNRLKVYFGPSRVPAGSTEVCLINHTRSMKSITFTGITKNGLVSHRPGALVCAVVPSTGVRLILRDKQVTRFRHGIFERWNDGGMILFEWFNDNDIAWHHVRTLSQANNRVNYLRMDDVVPQERVRICVSNQTERMKSLTFDRVVPRINGIVAMTQGQMNCVDLAKNQRIEFKLRDMQSVRFREAMSLRGFGGAQIVFEWSTIEILGEKCRSGPVCGDGFLNPEIQGDGLLGGEGRGVVAAGGLMCLLACSLQ